jgi:hypothetical protein
MSYSSSIISAGGNGSSTPNPIMSQEKSDIGIDGSATTKAE